MLSLAQKESRFKGIISEDSMTVGLGCLSGGGEGDYVKRFIYNMM